MRLLLWLEGMNSLGFRRGRWRQIEENGGKEEEGPGGMRRRRKGGGGTPSLLSIKRLRY